LSLLRFRAPLQDTVSKVRTTDAKVSVLRLELAVVIKYLMELAGRGTTSVSFYGVLLNKDK
jgi:uncharacterized membrane protein